VSPACSVGHSGRGQPADTKQAEATLEEPVIRPVELTVHNEQNLHPNQEPAYPQVRRLLEEWSYIDHSPRRQGCRIGC